MDLAQLQAEVVPWIEKCIEKEGLKDCKIEVTGTSGKGDNFAGEVIFVRVTGNEELNLVVKFGRNDSAKGKIMSDWYSREVAVYEDIIPTFQKYQMDKGVDVVRSFPKVYHTIYSENQQVVILENLITRGFQMHNKRQPMNMQHLRLVLENYANFHAVSFAMRHRDRELFQELTKNYTNILSKVFGSKSYLDYVQRSAMKVYKLVREKDEKLASVIQEFVENDLPQAVKTVVESDFDENEKVVTHGDCWNNNFMFEYKDGDTDSPIKVRILDWQLSSLNSPALDLGYFLYINCSEAQLSKFDELIGFYYDHLSKNLREYGCDPDQILTLEKLLEHWDKAAVFGFCFVISSLDTLLVEKEDVINLAEADNEEREKWHQQTKVKDVDLYRERVCAATGHYLKRINRI